MLAARKKTETVVVTLRIKEALRRRLEAAAAHNEVSVNSEITRRVEESFTRAELANLTENVDRLSALYERTLVSSKLVERYRLYADKCLELAQRFNDPESKVNLLSLANGWLALAAQRETNIGAPAEEPDQKWVGGPREAAMRLVAALGRPLRGNELDVAIKEPDSALGRLLRAAPAHSAPPDNEPELPTPRNRQAK